MGTWNSTIFGDDVACDVRDQFLALMAAGSSADDATRTLVTSWSAPLSDADDGPIFWLALAAALDWTGPDTLHIAYPQGVRTFDRKASLFFGGRTVQIVYRNSETADRRVNT